MAEKNSVKTLVDALRKAGADVQRIEDRMSTGIPDINFAFLGKDGFNYYGVEGWIECKEIAELPTRMSTRVKIGLRSNQAAWLERRSHVSDNVYLVVRCRYDNTWKVIRHNFRVYVGDGVSRQFWDGSVKTVHSTAELVDTILRKTR